MSIMSTNARFDINIDFGVDATTYPWPELTDFLLSLRNLQVATSNARPSVYVSTLLTQCWKLKRILSLSPCTPGDVLKYLQIINPNSSTVIGNCENQVIDLLDKINALALTLNPFSKQSENLIISDKGKPDGTPDIVLIVHKAATEFTTEWLKINELSAEVMTASNTKNSETFFQKAILFGLPEQHIYAHSQFEKIKTQAAWLISAPISRRIHVLVGPGSDSFKSKDYEPWPGCWPNEVIAMKPPAIDLLHIDIEPTWSPSRPNFEKTTNETTIDTASALLTIDNKWIVFDSFGKFRPNPLVLDLEGQFVEKKFKELNIGDVLAIHFGKSSREFLRQNAALFLEKRGKDLLYILEVVNTFKEKFRSFALNDDAQSRLINAGLDRDFVNFWLRYIVDDSAICPEDEKKYRIVADSIGVPSHLVDHKVMREYRSAIQHAGNIARTELLNELSINSEWKDHIQSASYLMNLSNAGSMLIAPVKEIYDDKFVHSVQQLGVVYSSIGEIMDES